MVSERPNRPRRVLILAPTSRDGQATVGVLAAAGVPCVICLSIDSLCMEATIGAGAVIVPEEAVLSDESDRLASQLERQPVWSDLPVIVLARVGAESPAIEKAMATLGNVSLLERPMRVSTLLSVLRAALRARERQYQVRDHLQEMEQVKERLARDAMLLSRVQDSVIVTDLNGIVTFWNDGATNLYGYTAEEMLGRPYADRLPEANRGKVVDWIAKIAAGDAEFQGEWLDYKRDGASFWIDATVRRVTDVAGNPVAIMGVSRDITARKKSEAEAEHASRMKDEFLATLSHELRTPLNAILGWSQILAGGIRDPEDLSEGLKTIERNARAQTQIIEDLLDMSRIISGKVQLDVQPVDFASIVQSAIETNKPAADTKGVHLDVKLDSATRDARGDPNRLQQVLWNLLTNAIKFTPQGGTVSVSLRYAEASAEIQVADTGVGIKSDFLPLVFDRFRQADASTTRRYGGLGLGLAIVKQLVELHGGTVRVHSEGVGRGTAFSISLPITLENSSTGAGVGSERRTVLPSSQLDASAEACRDLIGLKVLVVDDEPDARGLVRRILEDCEMTVTTAGSASEALRALTADPPDVLVSDIGMPFEDGYSLIRRVRELPSDQGGKTPSIALTAYARAQDRERSAEAGFQMHLAKPVEAVELIHAVASLARQARLSGKA